MNAELDRNQGKMNTESASGSKGKMNAESDPNPGTK